MHKRILILSVLLSLVAGAAPAQTCSAVPNNLTNGTTADASQVMADFNYALSCINGLRGYLGGLTMTNDISSPNTVIDTSAGVANSDDATTMMTLAALTKNANATWSLGTGTGCLDSGASLSANTWYHLFVVARTDTGVVDELCSTSATSPNTNITGWPSGNTKRRRIGSFYADSSAHIVPFIQNGDEFLWKSEGLSFVVGNLGPTLTAYTVSTPPGISTVALLKASAVNTVSAGLFLLSGLVSSFSGSADSLSWTANIYASGHFALRTDVSQHINAYANQSNTTLIVVTQGWIDTRGRFN